MKLFSRTSLVAFGTAAAVAASALTAPAFADVDDATVVATTEAAPSSEQAAPAEPTTVTATATATRTVTAAPTQEPSGSSDMENINDWIKIITAVIGALTTVLTFANNLDRFMGR